MCRDFLYHAYDFWIAFNCNSWHNAIFILSIPYETFKCIFNNSNSSTGTVEQQQKLNTFIMTNKHAKANVSWQRSLAQIMM